MAAGQLTPLELSRWPSIFLAVIMMLGLVINRGPPASTPRRSPAGWDPRGNEGHVVAAPAMSQPDDFVGYPRRMRQIARRGAMRAIAGSRFHRQRSPRMLARTFQIAAWLFKLLASTDALMEQQVQARARHQPRQLLIGLERLCFCHARNQVDDKSRLRRIVGFALGAKSEKLVAGGERKDIRLLLFRSFAECVEKPFD